MDRRVTAGFGDTVELRSNDLDTSTRGSGAAHFGGTSTNITQTYVRDVRASETLDLGD